MAFIEIFDKDSDGALIDHKKIFNTLKEVYPNYKKLEWCLHEIEALGDIEKERTLGDLVDEAQNSINGLIILWEEWESISNKLFQIINLIMSGATSNIMFNQGFNINSLYEQSEIVIELIDSSLWKIYFKDSLLPQKFSAYFYNYKITNNS